MDSRIEKTILHISKKFRERLILEDLAKMVCLSKFHFQKLFKQETGMSPLKYLNKIRLEYAAHFLIMYPESKQTDVAFECGYSSPAVFSRAFKQYYKVSPSEFQNRNGTIVKKEISNQQLNIPITYLTKKSIQVSPSNLEAHNLAKLYERIISGLEKPSAAYGIFLDVPFHKPLKNCRYYGGLENNEQRPAPEDTLEIEEGYYTYFDINGDFQSIGKQLLEFKKHYIDPSAFIISSLIGFEKIHLPTNISSFDYFTAQRTFFIKIQRT